MRCGGYRAGDRLLGDESKRGTRSGILAIQFGQKSLNLATSARGDPNFAFATFHRDLIEVPQIEHHIIGYDCLTPRVQPANDANPAALALGHYLEKLFLRARFKHSPRAEFNVAAEVCDGTRRQIDPRRSATTRQTLSS
jgi:hypothetical protein